MNKVTFAPFVLHADPKHLLSGITELLLALPLGSKLWWKFRSGLLVSVCLFFAPCFTHALDLSYELSFFRGIDLLCCVAWLTDTLALSPMKQRISPRVSSLLYSLVIQARWLVCVECRPETSLNGVEGCWSLLQPLCMCRCFHFSPGHQSMCTTHY